MAAPASLPCPACGQEITPPPQRRRKCPHCREWVSPRDLRPEPPAAADPDGRQQQEEGLRQEVEDEAGGQEAPAGGPARFADFKMFRSSLAPWDDLCRRAADFATALGPGRVISISHSEDNGEAILTVWYWRAALEGEPPEA